MSGVTATYFVKFARICSDAKYAFDVFDVLPILSVLLTDYLVSS